MLSHPGRIQMYARGSTSREGIVGNGWTLWSTIASIGRYRTLLRFRFDDTAAGGESEKNDIKIDTRCT